MFEDDLMKEEQTEMLDINDDESRNDGEIVRMGDVNIPRQER